MSRLQFLTNFTSVHHAEFSIDVTFIYGDKLTVKAAIIAIWNKVNSRNVIMFTWFFRSSTLVSELSFESMPRKRFANGRKELGGARSRSAR